MLVHEGTTSKRLKNRLSRLIQGKSGRGAQPTSPPNPTKVETIGGPPYHSNADHLNGQNRISVIGTSASREKPLPPPPEEDYEPEATNVVLNPPYTSSQPQTPHRNVVSSVGEEVVETKKTSPSGPPPSIPLPKTPQLSGGYEHEPNDVDRRLFHTPIRDSVLDKVLDPSNQTLERTWPDQDNTSVDLSSFPDLPEPSRPAETGMLDRNVNFSRPLPPLDTVVLYSTQTVDSPISTALVDQSPIRNSPTRTVSRPKGPRSPATPTSRQASGSSDQKT